MENLFIPATKFTPKIMFDCQNNMLEIIGESYPENITDFYAPILSWLKKYIESIEDKPINVTLELTYLNSSSSRTLLKIFHMFETAAIEGKNIKINWIYYKEDNDSLEFGEECQEDFEHLLFNFVQKEI